MKAKEIREHYNTLELLAERIVEEKEQLENLHFENKTSGLPNPILLRTKRRFIARLETVLSQMNQNNNN